MTYEIALDVKNGRFSREEALEKYRFLDADSLDEAVQEMDAVSYSEDGLTIIQVPEDW